MTIVSSVAPKADNSVVKKAVVMVAQMIGQWDDLLVSLWVERMVNEMVGLWEMLMVEWMVA